MGSGTTTHKFSFVDSESYSRVLPAAGSIFRSWLSDGLSTTSGSDSVDVSDQQITASSSNSLSAAKDSVIGIFERSNGGEKNWTFSVLNQSTQTGHF